MPPINTIVVQTILLPPDRRDETALGQAQRLLTKSLAPVDEALEGKEYLIGNFSAADIMLGHACFMSNRMGCVPDEMSNLKKYVENITNRPAGLFVIFSTYFLRLLISSGTQPILLLIKHACPSIISAAEKLPIKYSFPSSASSTGANDFVSNLCACPNAVSSLLSGGRRIV